MSEHQLSVDEAGKDLADCAAYVIEGITNSEAKNTATGILVDHYLSKDDVDSAAIAADSLEDPFFRDRLLIRVVGKCIDLNDDEYAFQLADAVEEDGLKSSALETAALRLSARGDYEKAIEKASILPHASETLSGIAVTMAASGAFDEAWEAVAGIDYFKSRVAARTEIAGIIIDSEEPKRALEWLEKAGVEAPEIEFIEDRIRALNEIAHRYFDAGEAATGAGFFQKAVEVANTLDNVHRDGFLVNSAIGLLKCGEVDAADETLDFVTDKTQLASCLYGFSKVFDSNDEKEEAIEAIEESYAMLKSMTEYEVRSTSAKLDMLAAVAIQFQRLGLTQRAVEIAHENIDDMQTNNALTSIAQLLVMDGKADEAAEVAKGIEPESERVAANIAFSDAANTVENKELAVSYLLEAAGLLPEVEQLIARAEIADQISMRLDAFGENEKAREIARGNLALVSEIREQSGQAIALFRLDSVYKKLGLGITADDMDILRTIAKTVDW